MEKGEESYQTFSIAWSESSTDLKAAGIDKGASDLYLDYLVKVGNGLKKAILSDQRLVAIFPLKKGKSVEDPTSYGVESHPKLCKEKEILASGSKGHEMCFSCFGRCRY